MAKAQEGITCVLIDRDTQGLEIGNRHLPANQYFMNGTIRAKNVIVPHQQYHWWTGSGWFWLANVSELFIPLAALFPCRLWARPLRPYLI